MDFRAPTPADADAIVALLVACDRVDFGVPDYDHDALMEEWDHPDVDVARDAFIADGAYGLLLGADLRAWVRPELRGGPLLAGLVERLERRARERGTDFLDWQVPRADPEARALAERRGWALVRHYADLRLPDSAVADLPRGETRPYDPARDEAAVQDLMERAFALGAGRLEPLEALLARNPDTSLWFVADADDGSLAGAVRSELRPTGFIEGYVRALATDPAHRGRGVASSLLGAASRALVDAGAVAVRLHVRSSNPNALRLYERLGFTGGWQMDEFSLELGL